MLVLARVGADHSEDQPPALRGHRAGRWSGGAIAPTGQLERTAPVLVPVTRSTKAVQALACQGR